MHVNYADQNLLIWLLLSRDTNFLDGVCQFCFQCIWFFKRLWSLVSLSLMMNWRPGVFKRSVRENCDRNWYSYYFLHRSSAGGGGNNKFPKKNVNSLFSPQCGDSGFFLSNIVIEIDGTCSYRFFYRLSSFSMWI